MKIIDEKIKTPVAELVDTSYQKRFLRRFIMLIITIVLGQTVFYLLTENIWLSAFNSLILLALWFGVWILGKYSYNLASSFIILLCLVIILSSILTTGLGNSTIFWFFIFPILATFLKGKRGGGVWLMILVLILAALYLAVQLGYVETFAISYDATTFQQLIISISLVALFIYFYQDSIDQKTTLIQDKEKKLSDIYTQLQDAIHRREAMSQSLQENLTELERKKARDVALLQSIGEGVIAVDSEGKIIFINPTVERMFNYYETKLEGKPYDHMFQLYDESGEPVPPDQSPLHKTLQKRTPERSDAYFYRNYNEELIPVAVTSTPIELDGEYIGAIEVFRDTSEERAIARAKDEFVSLASHQLRTPLNAIKWYTERLLKTAKLEPKELSYLETIHEDSVRMTDLLGDYLNVSRLELKTTDLQSKNIDPVQIIEDSLQDLAPLIKEKSLEIKRKIPDELAINTDAKLLSMVVQNLVSNAVKYTPDNGTITISATKYSGADERYKEGIVMSVEDTGMGIPTEEQSKLFTKLFRAKNALTSDEEGTGLGLYTTKAAIDRLGGRIWFDSKPGKGSQFSVTLPDLDNDIMQKTGESHE